MEQLGFRPLALVPAAPALLELAVLADLDRRVVDETVFLGVEIGAAPATKPQPIGPARLGIEAQVWRIARRAVVVMTKSLPSR
jgi:hypothetical protein